MFCNGQIFALSINQIYEAIRYIVKSNICMDVLALLASIEAQKSKQDHDGQEEQRNKYEDQREDIED